MSHSRLDIYLDFILDLFEQMNKTIEGNKFTAKFISRQLNIYLVICIMFSFYLTVNDLNKIKWQTMLTNITLFPYI